MWNDSRSLVLSKVCVVLFMVLLVVCMILAPRLVSRLMMISEMAELAGRGLFLGTIYAGSVPAAALLVSLLVLLRRIAAGSVFVKENVACLRHISWCCFTGAVICIASAFYYLPWAAIGVAAAFMGVVLRVVKNVIAKAVSLQDEAELVI